MAVSTLAGCVSVHRPPVPGPSASRPSTAPIRPSVPRPDGRAEPQVVQAPALEALEMVGPDGAPSKPPPTTPAEPRLAAPATTPTRQPPSPRPHPEPRPRTPPRVGIPAEVREKLRRGADVCALGRTYGGWRADSPEGAICERAYGR